jgi:hypothetical protein
VRKPRCRIPTSRSEILDHIVDHLHDTKAALRNCCLVSKSWIPRTRKHLFADVDFRPARHLWSWKEKFPDPSTSPAYYAKTLLFGCFYSVTTKDAEVGGWIRGFSRVEHLAMDSRKLIVNELVSLVPFHGFSLAIRSLRMTFDIVSNFPQIFNLILSFPLLEDLAVTVSYVSSAFSIYGLDEPPTAAQPSSPPMLTGSLELNLEGGMEPFVRRLLSLPGGIHFRKLDLKWVCEQDLSATMKLVEGCSHTLESLDISDLRGTFIRHPRPHR